MMFLVPQQANGTEMSVAQLNSRIAAFAVSSSPQAGAGLARAQSGPLPAPLAVRTRAQARSPTLGGRSSSGPLPPALRVAAGGMKVEGGPDASVAVSFNPNPTPQATAGARPAIRLTAAQELAMRGITIKPLLPRSAR